MIKNIIQKFFYLFGYEVKKKYNKDQQFNNLKEKIDDNPVILDIAQTKGNLLRDL